MFDSAQVWIHAGPDSVPLLVEVARTDEQRELGLSRRQALDSASGMLFVWDEPQSSEVGFWMWRTGMPLDGAFIDSAGVIAAVVGMEPCEAAYAEACERYFAGVPFSSALEVNRGWFAAHGVGVGSRVRIKVGPTP